ncbi:glutathione S- transferase, nitrogen catabolite repression regulator [Trapelia coarctata]|nr:glutathione S- transferase, nitrogen catabolite repression regulator [Trapelia coarctata]
MSKPITLFSHATGPNPWKVAIVLEELGISYETKFMDIQVLHTPEYEKYNPNGRVPAIIDPNTDITLWESGAIIQYLVENYDPENKLHTPSGPNKYLESQWLHYQTSGQGPYFGQGAWFANFHAEKIPSAIERYTKEIIRVTKVLDAALEGKQYLVGDKCSYADLCFVTWYQMIAFIDKTGDVGKALVECKNYSAWMERLTARPAVKKVLEAKAAKAKEAGR